MLKLLLKLRAQGSSCTLRKVFQWSRRFEIKPAKFLTRTRFCCWLWNQFEERNRSCVPQLLCFGMLLSLLQQLVVEIAGLQPNDCILTEPFYEEESSYENGNRFHTATIGPAVRNNFNMPINGQAPLPVSSQDDDYRTTSHQFLQIPLPHPV